MAIIQLFYLPFLFWILLLIFYFSNGRMNTNLDRMKIDKYIFTILWNYFMGFIVQLENKVWIIIYLFQTITCQKNQICNLIIFFYIHILSFVIVVYNLNADPTETISDAYKIEIYEFQIWLRYKYVFKEDFLFKIAKQRKG
jgi:hypothetical protein